MSHQPNEEPARFRAARFVYEEYRKREEKAFEIATTFGRWLVTSMLLTNGAGLIAVFSFMGSSNARAIDPSAIQWMVTFLTAGLVSAFACGACSWVNWSLHSNGYWHATPIEMLWKADVWLTGERHEVMKNITNIGAIIFGVVSVVMIPLTVWAAMSGIKVPPEVLDLGAK
jgi:hypothetical protein